MKHFLSLVILVAGSVVTTNETALGVDLSPAKPAEPPERVANLRRYTDQELAVLPSTASSFRVPIWLDDGPHELVLERHSLRASDFQVLVRQDDGTLAPSAAPENRTFRGYVDGATGSRVAATVVDGALSAVVVTEQGVRWYIEPADSPATAASGRRMHVVYRAEDVFSTPHSCGATDEPVERSFDGVANVPYPFPGSASALRVADIAFDADSEFYRANGSSIVGTVNDIESVMNGVSLLYESELQITYEITTIIVRTSGPDPYTEWESSSLLTQFRNEWNVNMLGVHRDIAHLMTGKNLDGAVIGAATTGAMCEVCAGARGYGLSQSRFSSLLADRVCLTAHEIGHSWGAVHCDGESDCGLMCSSIGGCSGSCVYLGATSAATIQNAAATLACISTLAPPASFPFCETFDGGVNNGAWSYNAGTNVSVLAGNPPSPPYALLIDDCCTACANGPDEIRSNYIALAGVDSAIVFYYTQHAGGPSTAGSQLVVEYWSASRAWVELNRLVSDGIDQTHFDRWVHTLPTEGLHDQLRIRFRLEGVSTSDKWFVDNVAVVRSEPETPVFRVRQGASGDATGASWEAAFADVSDALTVAACAGGTVTEVWVTAGSYRPDHDRGDRASTFRLVNGVALLGGFFGDEESKDARAPGVHETVLSGDIGIQGIANDNAFHVVTGNAIDTTAALDGFTIRDGNANTSTADGGGGLRLSGSTPTIKNCVFTSNIGGNGGAVQISSLSGPTMTGCTFFGNTAVASGGGVHVGSGCTVMMDRCEFFENRASAFGGGVYCGSGLVDASNSVFVGNAASSGAAIYNFLGNVLATNCTIGNNSAQGSVGGVLNSNASATIASSILWGNRDSSGTAQSSQVSGTSVSLNYGCVQGLTGSLGGISNTGVDPQFVDSIGMDGISGTSDDDLRLLPSSPAINTGDPDSGPAVDQSIDLDGHPRVLCGRVDMGAFEFGIFDSNCDRAVDFIDLKDWPGCMAGPDSPLDGPYCRAFDADANGHVDLRDFRLFQNFSTGLAR